MRDAIFLVVMLSSCGDNVHPVLEQNVDNLATNAVALVNKRNITQCSGVLISAKVVLTAAHCLVISNLSVGFGANGNDIIIPYDETLTHPNWDGQYNDLGLIRLENNAPFESSIEYADEVLKGDTALAIGYGTPELGIRHFITMTVTGENKSWILLSPVSGITCNGDSGSPLFVGNFLAGINIRSNCEDYAVAEKVYTQLDFINSF